MVKAKNIVIGITGTMTSGKAAIRYFLIDRGFISIRFTRPILNEGLKRKKDMTNRDNWLKILAEIRRKKGTDILSKMASKKIKENERYVVCPIRYPEDIKYFKKLYNALVIFIDAPFDTRYKRTLVKELGSNMSKDEFKKKDKFEASPTGKDKKYLPDMNGCRKLADEIIMNDGSLNKLNEKLEKILRKYKIPDLINTDSYDDFDI